MTDIDLDHLRTLCDEATGQWERIGTGIDNPRGRVAAYVYGADADFIIAARTAVPALIAEVKRLRAQVEAVRAQAMAADLDVDMGLIPADAILEVLGDA